MKKHFFIFPLLLILIGCGPGKVHYPDVEPPIAEKKPVDLTIHGDTRVDNYYWLNQRDDSAVIKYLNAENHYLDTMLSATRDFQDKIYEELKGRIKEKDSSVPYKEDDYYFYTRYEEGYDYPIYCRKYKSLDAPEEIVIDGNKLGEGQKFLSFYIEYSPDKNIAGIAMDTIGRRFYTIKFKDLETGQFLADEIPATTGNIVWANDNKTVFYGVQDPATLRGDRIFLHKISSEIKNDKLIFTEKDSTLDAFIYKSRSKKIIFIGSGRTDADIIRYFSADGRENIRINKIADLRPNVEYYADHFNDRFYIYTNLDAKNYRLVEAPMDQPGVENWTDVIPERDSILLRNYTCFKDYLALEEESKGLTTIRLVKWSDHSDYVIQFDEPVYLSYLDRNPDPNADSLRFSYQSLTTPRSVYDYSLVSGQRNLLKRQEILGGFDPENYQSERVLVPARDGKAVPLSIVYRKDRFKKNSSNPALIYGYGSYGSTMYGYFNANLISLLDRGFVYAIAHVRGGQEMGGAWYEDGKMMNKKNTFFDFIDCSRYLVNQKYSAGDKLFAKGGSAGGLLVGAASNMAPDLYKGIIANVPFVDVVTTMLDESIPLTTFEWLEWGNPNIKEQYEYMMSYSPYDNVEAKDYPNMLVTTSLHDSQVQYWEPAKWVAKLRDLKTDNNFIYLHTNMDAGHGGASGRFKRLKDTALEYVFMFDLINIKE